MINLKSLITESSKNVKVLIKGAKGESDQSVQFLVSDHDNVFVFMAKTSKDLDKLDLVGLDDTHESLLKYLETKTNIKFKWDYGYNKNGAGYGFKIDTESILKKL